MCHIDPISSSLSYIAIDWYALCFDWLPSTPPLGFQFSWKGGGGGGGGQAIACSCRLPNPVYTYVGLLSLF